MDHTIFPYFAWSHRGRPASMSVQRLLMFQRGMEVHVATGWDWDHLAFHSLYWARRKETFTITA